MEYADDIGCKPLPFDDREKALIAESRYIPIADAHNISPIKKKIVSVLPNNSDRSNSSAYVPYRPYDSDYLIGPGAGIIESSIVRQPAFEEPARLTTAANPPSRRPRYHPTATVDCTLVSGRINVSATAASKATTTALGASTAASEIGDISSGIGVSLTPRDTQYPGVGGAVEEANHHHQERRGVGVRVGGGERSAFTANNAAPATTAIPPATQQQTTTTTRTFADHRATPPHTSATGAVAAVVVVGGGPGSAFRRNNNANKEQRQQEVRGGGGGEKSAFSAVTRVAESPSPAAIYSPDKYVDSRGNKTIATTTTVAANTTTNTATTPGQYANIAVTVAPIAPSTTVTGQYTAYKPTRAPEHPITPHYANTAGRGDYSPMGERFPSQEDYSTRRRINNDDGDLGDVDVDRSAGDSRVSSYSHSYADGRPHKGKPVKRSTHRTGRHIPSRHQAAIRIQTIWRGYIVRKHDHDKCFNMSIDDRLSLQRCVDYIKILFVDYKKQESKREHITKLSDLHTDALQCLSREYNQVVKGKQKQDEILEERNNTIQIMKRQITTIKSELFSLRKEQQDSNELISELKYEMIQNRRTTNDLVYRLDGMANCSSFKPALKPSATAGTTSKSSSTTNTTTTNDLDESKPCDVSRRDISPTIGNFPATTRGVETTTSEVERSLLKQVAGKVGVESKHVETRCGDPLFEAMYAPTNLARHRSDAQRSTLDDEEMQCEGESHKAEDHEQEEQRKRTEANECDRLIHQIGLSLTGNLVAMNNPVAMASPTTSSSSPSPRIYEPSPSSTSSSINQQCLTSTSSSPTDEINGQQSTFTTIPSDNPEPSTSPTPSFKDTSPIRTTPSVNETPTTSSTELTPPENADIPLSPLSPSPSIPSTNHSTTTVSALPQSYTSDSVTGATSNKMVDADDGFNIPSGDCHPTSPETTTVNLTQDAFANNNDHNTITNPTTNTTIPASDSTSDSHTTDSCVLATTDETSTLPTNEEIRNSPATLEDNDDIVANGVGVGKAIAVVGVNVKTQDHRHTTSSGDNPVDSQTNADGINISVDAENLTTDISMISTTTDASSTRSRTSSSIASEFTPILTVREMRVLDASELLVKLKWTKCAIKSQCKGYQLIVNGESMMIVQKSSCKMELSIGKLYRICVCAIDNKGLTGPLSNYIVIGRNDDNSDESSSISDSGSDYDDGNIERQKEILENIEKNTVLNQNSKASDPNQHEILTIDGTSCLKDNEITLKEEINTSSTTKLTPMVTSILEQLKDTIAVHRQSPNNIGVKVGAANLAPGKIKSKLPPSRAHELHKNSGKTTSLTVRKNPRSSIGYHGDKSSKEVIVEKKGMIKSNESKSAIGGGGDCIEWKG